jgi:catechol 2,3-dioxygenase-like lactoylglutathione lyase family enzyme
MKIRAIDFICLPVSDLRTAARFYQETLGLAPGVYSEEHGWAEFDCGNVALALKAGASQEEIAAGPRIAFGVGDIAATLHELVGAGIRPYGMPVDHGCCRHLDLTDPDGHRILLHQRADGTAG